VIVADTNLILRLYLDGEWTGQSEAVLRKDGVWAAPLLWRSEFRNTLVTLIRAGELDLETATAIMDDAERRMSECEYPVVSQRVVELAVGSRCSGYDCEFVALAETLQTPLVTSDRRLLRAFPRIAVAPEAFGRS
jgi:predicted nucleic acid-binding protein